MVKPSPRERAQMRRSWRQQRESAARFRERYRDAGPAERREMQRQLRRRIEALPPDERAIARQRIQQHLRPLPADERRALRQDFGRLTSEEAARVRQQVRALPPRERAEVVRRLRHYRSLPESERQELRALGRQPHATRTATEQRRAPTPLERLEPRADARLRAAKRLGGPAHRAQAGDGDEGAERGDVRARLG